MTFDKNKDGAWNKSHHPSGEGSMIADQTKRDGPINQKVVQHTNIDLARTIRKSRKLSAYKMAERTEFLPISELDSIINHENIRNDQAYICPDMKEGELQALCDNIRNDSRTVDRRRIFAVLALIKRTVSISDFISAKISDSQLPLEFSWRSGKGEVGKYEVFRAGDNTHIALFDTWSDTECELFQGHQGCMLAPVFQYAKDSIEIHKIGQHRVLPFLKYEKMGEGGYGNVFRVKIHPSHHTFGPSMYSDDENPDFALKTLQWKGGREEFHQEVDALTMVVANPHPHLIKLLLAYERGDTYHLLFNCADENLLQYWERNRTEALTLYRVHWFIDQCTGLAGGLRRIHRIHTDLWNTDGAQFPSGRKKEKNMGRHGDLKPENILCFHRDGKVQLVIGDFGFSRYHSSDSRSKDQLAGWTGAYRPPECDMKHPISQRYDIWSLGCVFLIFISWFVLDYETGVEGFAKARAKDDIHIDGQAFDPDKFFNIENGKPELKTSVKNWIFKIRATKTCPPFIGDFLDLIEDGLLVPISGDRHDSDYICSSLQSIRKDCQNYTGYCLAQDTHTCQEKFNIPSVMIKEGMHANGESHQLNPSHGNFSPNLPKDESVESHASQQSIQPKKARFAIPESSSSPADGDRWKPLRNNVRIHSHSQQSRMKNITRQPFLHHDAISSQSTSDEDEMQMETNIMTLPTTSERTEVREHPPSNTPVQDNDRALGEIMQSAQSLKDYIMTVAIKSVEKPDSETRAARHKLSVIFNKLTSIWLRPLARRIDWDKYWVLFMISLAMLTFVIFSRDPY